MTPAFLDLLRLHVSAEAYRQVPPDDLWAKVRDALDEIAFRVLLERIGSRVYQRCRAILRDDHLAEEAFQDTFRDLIRKRASIPTYQSAAAWAYQTATNHSRHLRRKGWLWRTRERGRPVEPAEQSAPQADHADEVDRLLAALPDRYRRPIELVYWQGLTHAEAAAALGWPKGTVDSYVAQGLKRLRAESLKLGLPALTLGVILARPANAVSEAVLSHLAQTSWAAGCVPELAGPWWLSWKTLAAGVLGAGLVVGGLARREGFEVRPPIAATPVVSPSPVVESLQERNARIATDELAPQLRELLQRFYQPPHQVGVVRVQAVGSEVEVEFRVNPPVPAVTGLATRLRGRYCMVLRRLSVYGQPDGVTRWYPMDRDKPIALKITIPFGPQVEIVRGRDEFAASEKLFAKLPSDDRAEPDQIRALFGSETAMFLPVETRGVSGFSGGLVAATVDGGLFVRDAAGRWRAAGTCPGWEPVVADGRVYCFNANGIQSRLLAHPNASWEKWCDEPTLGPGEQAHGPLFVAGGRLCMTMEPHGLSSRPLNNPKAEWKRSSHALGPHPVVEVGETLFGTDGKQLLKRPVAQPDAAWVPVVPLPTPDHKLVADGNRLLAYTWGPGLIYSRPASAGPDVPWEEVGRVHDPYQRK